MLQITSSCTAITLVAAALALGALFVGVAGPGNDKKANAASSLSLAAGSLVVLVIGVMGAFLFGKHTTADTSPVIGNVYPQI